MTEHTVHITTTPGACTEGALDDILQALVEGRTSTRVHGPVLGLGADGALTLTCQVQAYDALEAAMAVNVSLRDAFTAARVTLKGVAPADLEAMQGVPVT